MAMPDPAEPVTGYLSEESKRRFPLMAGVLGAVAFLVRGPGGAHRRGEGPRAGVATVAWP